MPSLPGSGFNARTKNGLLVLAALLTIYLLRYYVFGRIVSGFSGNYLLPSLLWGALALVIYLLMPRGRPEVRVRQRPIFNWLAFFSALVLVAAVYAAGIFSGYGRSPYEHNFRSVAVYIFYLGFMLVGMELSRAWLINYLFKKKPLFGIALVSLLFTFFAFSPWRLTAISSALEGAEFVGNIFLPGLAENLLASYLVFLGGALPAIIYRGLILAYQWFMPVLPHLNWVVWALIGTFVPVFGMVLVYGLYQSEVLRIRSREKESPAGWVAVSAVSVLMIWFAVGVFSIFPNVIISGSMEPEIDIGDVVIVRRVEPEQVVLGDVIQYREIERDVRINHRVIEIREDERGLPLFITKGDANANPDSDPVLAEQLTGKVVHVVPRIGWITIVLRRPG